MAQPEAGGTPVWIVEGAFNQFSPAFSPDGKWLAYVSTQSSRREVFVQSYPASGPRLQVSSDGGVEPRWGRDGHELFYYSGSAFMRAEVRTVPELSASRPTRLFEGRYRQDVGVPGYPATTSHSTASAF